MVSNSRAATFLIFPLRRSETVSLVFSATPLKLDLQKLTSAPWICQLVLIISFSHFLVLSAFSFKEWPHLATAQGKWRLELPRVAPASVVWNCRKLKAEVKSWGAVRLEGSGVLWNHYTCWCRSHRDGRLTYRGCKFGQLASGCHLWTGTRVLWNGGKRD